MRTVQYYDKKGLLHPSATTQGGNRLYGPADAAELRFILLLKSMGLGLAQIKGVLESPHRTSVAQELLQQQRLALAEELDQKQAQLAELDALLDDIKLTGTITIATKDDMAQRMKDQKSYRHFMVSAVVGGLLADVAWIGGLIYSIRTGNWWVFAVGLAAAILACVLIVRSYWRHTTYICAACHGEFKLKFWEWFFAVHTLKTRKLTCPCCGVKDWCVERWYQNPVEVAASTCITRGE